MIATQEKEYEVLKTSITKLEPKVSPERLKKIERNQILGVKIKYEITYLVPSALYAIVVHQRPGAS